ncbi:hypothetical protein [Streptomyces sp. JJ66]|uniref:hypothetical protein n=1 Tax=Streptomyces sp. JJ66 TaxID=2803843 RepID=UPI0027D8CA5E|nr:hypothetical protein [Streptomyces sp. JJ66]
MIRAATPADVHEPSIGFYRSPGAEPLDEWTVFRLTGDPLRTLARAHTAGVLADRHAASHAERYPDSNAA